MTHILYNPKSGNNSGKNYALMLEICYPDSTSHDITEIYDYAAFFAELAPSDSVILCGGDGMLNHFVNDTKDIPIQNRIFLYAMGTGNDFARDIGKSGKDEPDYPINDYIKDLPSVTVNGITRLFINGVGYGIDGYCCEVGDRLREQNQKLKQDKPINYTSIAIKGLLGDFKPVNAKVTVDGKEYEYQNVWIAPTMNGRYYGGGMMPAPEQNRLSPDRQLTLTVMHCKNKLKALCIFPSLFKGTHSKYTNAVSIHRGKEITVEFDRPVPLQIDGETVLNVTSYTASASQPYKSSLYTYCCRSAAKIR